MYYVAREKYRDNVQSSDVTGGESSYYFDAFVSYADEDKRFVIELVKFLEKENCVYTIAILSPGQELQTISPTPFIIADELCVS